MELSQQVCSRARLTRDARFDGKFFIGVLSTKIYCRPICPARTAKESNVRYYPTAAAAQEAGFRPCLRCRPECSPGTPAWLGTPSTVSRALKLISESGLDDGGVESLAEKLGMGSRHLRRLFLQHLGASPSAVAKTQRLQFAKKLIDETRLPMQEIAIAAGYGCVRRFNATFRDTYKRTPTQIRKLARKSDEQAANQYVFRLRYRQPFHWDGMLAFLSLRAIPGVELVEDGRYRRTIAMDGERGWIEVSCDTQNDALIARVQFGNPRSLFSIIERIRAMFDLNADWLSIARSLQADSALATRLASEPGLRVPGCWDGFELAVRAILGQQVSVKGATTLSGRIAAQYGEPFQAADELTHVFPSAQALVNMKAANAGMPTSRVESIRSLARAVKNGDITFTADTDADELRQRLCAIPGIGPWTAQYVTMRALGQPDAFPTGDLGLLKALELRNARELEQRSEAWRPWRAYAAMYMWCVSPSGNSAVV
jgi:AraC family transcriptional regulator of adaptative response / DNA-3-methyladenine glycosylase II